MLFYCLKRKKNTESIDPKVSATSNGKTTILSNVVLNVVIKNQKGLLSNLGIRTPLSETPILGDVLF